MTGKTPARCGTWPSPISAQRIAGGQRALSSPRLAGDTVWWLEGRPAEAGRVVAMCAEPGAAPRAVTPAPFNVRSRVHEYGGGALLPLPGGLVFSNFADNLVYWQQGESTPVPLTDETRQYHADFEPDRTRRRVIAVQEDHRREGVEATNRLVAITLAGGAPPSTLAEGFDFYAAPRLSPDGRHLAWLCWNHPGMPWDGCELWCATLDEGGEPVGAQRIAGGPGESLLQPSWSPQGVLHVVSDRSGWWNLYRVEGQALRPLCTREAEFGRPMWQFGAATFGFEESGSIVATWLEDGVSRLARLDPASGLLQPIATPYTDIDTLCVGRGFAVMLAASPTLTGQIARIDLASGDHSVIARSLDDAPATSDLSTPRTLSYGSAGGRRAHAFFYPPASARWRVPDGEKPPLIVSSHGGPTSMSSSGLRMGIQFWTSRGFAVLDVNYGGSSGYGRAYRELLNGQWGIVDVEDCVAGARHLADAGLVDGERMAIRGSSASGFTTLSALAFHRVFKAGASHYGVADLAALDAETHKFESRYTQTLLAGPADRDRVYAERSPALHADKLTSPMIFFQGLDDRVVPPAQSEAMVAALKARGVPVAYLAFAGEGHGFRRQDTQRRVLEAELSFYAQVFGFTPADDIKPVEIIGG